MKVALGQIDCEPGAVERNAAKMVEFARKAASSGCDLVVFPEMSDVGYEMPKIVESATPINEGAVPALQAVAKECGLHIAAGIAERAEDKIYNALVTVGPGGDVIAKYRKIHLVTAAPMFEHRYICAGEDPVVIDIGEMRVGFMTCYDIRFPELARELTRRGAEVIVISSAFPLVRLEHWRTLVRARSIENQAYVLAANRVGSEGGVTFCGASVIHDPYGTVLASENEIDERLVTARIFKDRVSATRERMQALQDRREDVYGSWNASA